MNVYEFRFSSTLFGDPSEALTMSIHKTRKGAQKALKAHEIEFQKILSKRYGREVKIYDFIKKKAWSIRKSTLIE